MHPGLIVRFRPEGPWRLGPDSGARDRVDRVLHSDRLHSAVTAAMDRLGAAEEWLDATFRNPAGPVVRFSSCFPYQEDLLLAIPPRNLWPPPASLKVRWRGARFVPLPVIAGLTADKAPDENRWVVDGASECLVPADRPRGPFRESLRSHAAVDRLSGNVEVHSTACLEFREDAGMWAAAAFADEEARNAWSDRLVAAFRLLADSGIGGKRSWGWGRSRMPEFREGLLPALILPAPPEPPPPVEGEQPPPAEHVYWLLSLLSPAAEDRIDWERGDYAIVSRSGRVESPAAWGGLKKFSRMVAEGSVLFSAEPVRGAAADVAPDGFAHPVYRAGYAFAISIPWRVAA